MAKSYMHFEGVDGVGYWLEWIADEEKMKEWGETVLAPWR